MKLLLLLLLLLLPPLPPPLLLISYLFLHPDTYANNRGKTSWWRHQMETFSALLAICAGNSPVPSPHKGQWHGAMMFSLICTRINYYYYYYYYNYYFKSHASSGVFFNPNRQLFFNGKLYAFVNHTVYNTVHQMTYCLLNDTLANRFHVAFKYSMMTSSNGNFFRVTGHLCGEFIGLRWILRTKASDADLWCFLWSAPE